MKIGECCSINSILPTGKDAQLIEIGDAVIISCDCRLLSHDASLASLTNHQHSFLMGRIKIGDNSFIGCGSIILPGVTLAKKTLVGAGSVVTKSVFEEGQVICGNPAKKVGTVEEFFRKNMDKSIKLAGISDRDFGSFIRHNEHKLIIR